VLGRLASRATSHKVGQTVGLLVIPVVVLLGMFFFNAKGDIDKLNRELAAVFFAQALVSTPRLDAAQMDAKTQARMQGWASQIGLPQNSSNLPTVPFGQNSNAAAGSLERHVALLSDVALASGLSFDADGRSNVLAQVAFNHAPRLVLTVDQLAKDASVPNMKDRVAAYLMAATATRGHLQHMETALKQVGIVLDADAAKVLAQFEGTAKRLEEAGRLLAQPETSVAVQSQQIATLTADAEALVTAVSVLQKPVLAALQVRIENRLSTEWQNLLLLCLAGFLSAAVGIGLATLMMRSTLQRLYDVETAHLEAVAARRDAESVAVRFTSINADMSDLNKELADKVKQLKDAQAELVKRGRMEQLGQLTATIAHEVRNPLGAIRTSVFTMERKLVGKALDLEGPLQRIKNSVERCDSIISQLLDFSRNKEINSSLIGLDDWLAKLVRAEAEHFPDSIYIECALGLDDLQVSFDPARLKLAIQNLLGNAAEALASVTEKSAGQSQQQQRIWVTTLVRGNFAAIRVADNGPGIPAEYMQKIREPLFTTKSFGTGLGVPAVEQIANQHGGHLDIASDIGKGAIFTIHLPLPEAKKEAA
jgi:signal transduction histidine kinase